MKKTLSIIAAALVCTGLSAQTKEQAKENPDLFRAVRDLSRTEIIIPDVDGYKALKTDLHVHTSYSDGNCTPEYRVTEGWRDGLDAIAITDHIEYRPNDDGKGNGTLLITNKTSFLYLLNGPSTSVNVLLPPLSTIRVSFKNGQELRYTVSNMFYGVDKNPEVSIKLRN